MVKHYEEIPDFLIPWIKEQKVLWVATAPLSADGHVNVSPKGIFGGNFCVVNSRRVWFEDLTGSGIETISHIRENRRVTLLFNSLQGAPRICRMYGKGKSLVPSSFVDVITYTRQGSVLEFGTPEYNALLSASNRQPGSRAIIVLDLYHVSTSCGLGIPIYSFVEYRRGLPSFLGNLQNNDHAAEETTNAPAKKGLKSYWKDHNQKSLDGLSGLQSALDTEARVEYVDLKNFETGTNGKPLRFDTQLAVAFMFGTVVGATLLRVLRR